MNCRKASRASIGITMLAFLSCAVPVTRAQSIVSSCPVLTHTLAQGMQGTDVGTLQAFLKHESYFQYPEVTGYFGPITEHAVQAFQKARNIVASGTPETTGFGLVGPRTRAAIAASCEQQGVSAAQATGTTSAQVTVQATSTRPIAGTQSATSSAPQLPPAAPDMLARNVSFLKVHLSWNAVPAATSYLIERATMGDTFVTLASSSVPSFTDTQVATGHTYRYRVVASNSAGTSTPSDSVEAYLTNPDASGPISIATVLGAFANLNKNYNDPSFTLTAPSSNSPGAFSYACSDPTAASINGATVTPHGAGTVTITATQAATGAYTSATAKATLHLSGYCEVNANPCLNGGTCTDSATSTDPTGPINSYSCSCASGYSGTDCTLTSTNCDGATGSVCLNGGVCVASTAGGACQCPSCYTGNDCGVPIPGCTPS